MRVRPSSAPADEDIVVVVAGEEDEAGGHARPAPGPAFRCRPRRSRRCPPPVHHAEAGAGHDGELPVDVGVGRRDGGPPVTAYAGVREGSARPAVTTSAVVRRRGSPWRAADGAVRRHDSPVCGVACAESVVARRSAHVFVEQQPAPQGELSPCHLRMRGSAGKTAGRDRRPRCWDGAMRVDDDRRGPGPVPGRGDTVGTGVLAGQALGCGLTSLTAAHACTRPEP